MTEHTLSFTFDRAFIRAGIRRDFWWRVGVLWAVFAVFFVVLIFMTGHGGDPAFWIGLVVGLALVMLLFARKLSQMVERTFALWSTQSPGHTMTLTADEEGLTLALERGSSRYAWTSLRRLWRYRDVWLLEVVRMTSVLFPVQVASPAMREFVVERCRAAGVRV